MSERKYMAEEEVAIDLRGLMLAVWRAKIWIVPLTVLLCVGTIVMLSMMPPRYRAEAKILIEMRDTVFGSREVNGDAGRELLDQEGITSQVQLLKSRDLARRVVRKLKLSEIAEFNPAGKGKGGSLLGDLGIIFGLSKDPLQVSPEERVLEAYFMRLSVFPVEKSRVIAVGFWSRDRQLAAKVTNAIVAAYFELQSEVKQAKTKDEAQILAPEITRLQDEVKAAERAVEDYRAGAGLFVGTNNTTLVQQQLTELSTQVSTAKAQQAEAQAKAGLVRSLLKNGGSLDTSSDVLKSQLIQRLRERQVTLKAQLAELSTTLLANHPRIKALRSQMADLNAQIKIEAQKILRSLENDSRITAQRIDSLNARLAELKAESAGANEKSVRLRALQRDAEIKSKQLASLLERYRQAEAGSTARSLPVNARMISTAAVPAKPYFPKIAPTATVVTLAGFLLMVAFVLMREFLSGRALQVVTVGPPEPVEADDLPVSAGAVPADAHVRWEESSNLRRMMPLEEASEADRVRLNTAREIWRRIGGEGGKARVVVTSVTPGECARVAAFALARAGETEPGARSVLVDLVGPETDAAPLPGLSDLLAGTVSFAQVIFRDRQSRAHILPRGAKPVGDADISGERFATVLDALDYTYDHVLIDVGPLSFGRGVAELLLAADHVVLATPGSISDPQTTVAYEMLRRNGVREVSVVSTGASPEPGGADDDIAVA